MESTHTSGNDHRGRGAPVLCRLFSSVAKSLLFHADDVSSEVHPRSLAERDIVMHPPVTWQLRIAGAVSTPHRTHHVCFLRGGNLHLSYEAVTTVERRIEGRGWQRTGFWFEGYLPTTTL